MRRLTHERLAGDVRYSRRVAFALCPVAGGYYQPRALWLPIARALRPIMLEALT